MNDIKMLIKNLHHIHNAAVRSYRVQNVLMKVHSLQINATTDNARQKLARIFIAWKSIENSCLAIKCFITTLERVCYRNAHNLDENYKPLEEKPEETPYIQEIMLMTHGVFSALHVMQDAIEVIGNKFFTVCEYKEYKTIRELRNACMSHPFNNQGHRMLDDDGIKHRYCAAEIKSFTLSYDPLELTLKVNSIHENGKRIVTRSFNIVNLLCVFFKNTSDSLIIKGDYT